MKKAIILFLILITLTVQATEERYIAGYDTRTFPTPSETTVTSTVTTITELVGGAVLTLPWADENVANNITLTNITQITNRSYSDLSDLPTFLPDTTIDTNQTAFESIQTDLNSMYCQIPDSNNASRLSYLVIADPIWTTESALDTTLDSNVTASNSWLGKPHTFTSDINFSNLQALALFIERINATGDVNFVDIGISENLYISGKAFYPADHSPFENEHELVDKEYVDIAITAINTAYYLYDSASGIADYKDTAIIPSPDVEASVTDTLLSDGEYIQGWISPIDANISSLIEGIYEFHIHAEKTDGAQTLQLYWQLFERRADGTEVLIETSELGDNIVDGKEAHSIHLSLTYQHDLNADGRAVGKVFATVSGSGLAPTSVLYYRGNTASAFSVPSNTEVLTNVFYSKTDVNAMFVPYIGAVADLNLGSYGIKTFSDSNFFNVGVSNGIWAINKYGDAFIWDGELGGIEVGFDHNITGFWSSSFGEENMVTGDDSFATGFQNKLTADQTFTAGNGNEVSGQFGMALGLNCNVLAQTGICLGEDMTNYNPNSVLVQDLNVLGGGINVTGDSNFANISFLGLIFGDGSKLTNILSSGWQPDSTLDLNTTANTSWLGKAHTFTAIQTIQADLNITESGTDNRISFEPDLNRIWLGEMFLDYNGTAITIGG